MNPKPKPAAEDLARQPMTQLSSQTPLVDRDETRLTQQEFVETTTHASVGAGLVSAAAGWAAPFGRPP